MMELVSLGIYLIISSIIVALEPPTVYPLITSGIGSILLSIAFDKFYDKIKRGK